MANTTGSLRVLVSEAERGAAACAIDELEAAGHRVLRCHEPGTSVFPCVGLDDPAACPLHQTVDVALDVRRHSHYIPTRREEGTVCALRAHIPVVLAGSPLIDPITDYATELVDTPYNVVPAVERAAGATLPRHTQIATAAVQEFARARDIRAPFVVNVVRRQGALAVLIRDHAPLDRATRQILAVRVVAALRTFDFNSTGIDVAFEEGR